MFFHKNLCLSTIMSGDGLIDFFMFVDKKWAFVGDDGLPEEVDDGLHAVDDVDHYGVAGRLDDDVVEFEVGLHDFFLGTAPSDLHTLMQPSKLFFVEILCGASGGGAFKKDPDLEDMAEIGFRRIHDPFLLEEAFFVQLADRFPHGGAAQAEFFGEALLHKLGAPWKTAVQYFVPYIFICLQVRCL